MSKHAVMTSALFQPLMLRTPGDLGLWPIEAGWWLEKPAQLLRKLGMK